ncbi:hypothetical protein M2281_005257 [Mesorhizobium soli]|uniref:hypothetical protein n=1 Tax=Pseudaminobacter soli (ex Li et al. 2025) TaxID=1295366 RepID=UPI0024745E69|nr:hypothetical protein [Mesorhizobium soli]MDH6234637.1 hypothetical protein [Mesorhizobium soli]
MIEQCEPSRGVMRVGSPCDFTAVQVPRLQLSRRNRGFEDRFMKLLPVSGATALLLAYVQALLACPEEALDGLPQFVSGHLSDLVMWVTTGGDLSGRPENPGVRAARFRAIQTEMDRNFMEP